MVRGYHMCSYEVMTFMTSFSLLSYVPFPRSIIGEKQVQKGRGIPSVPYQPPRITLGASLSILCSSWEWHTLSTAGYYLLWEWYHGNHDTPRGKSGSSPASDFRSLTTMHDYSSHHPGLDASTTPDFPHPPPQSSHIHHTALTLWRFHP